METESIRKPSPNETRCITRHVLGHYSNLLVAGIYSVPQVLADESDLQRLDCYAPALVECIQQHPFLSATIQDASTKTPIWSRPTQLNPGNHFRVLRSAVINSLSPSSETSETALLKEAIGLLHNAAEFRFTDVGSKPAWALDVLPLPGGDKADHHRVFISFTYSHSHGDGGSGTAFHKTFHGAWQKSMQTAQKTEETIVQAPAPPLPDAADTPAKIPISFSYLLTPVLGTYLPSLLSRALGISANVSGTDDNTWTGSKTFTDTKTPDWNATTSVECFSINPQALRKLLACCKRKGTTLTPLLNHLVAQALSKAFSASSITLPPGTNFTCQIPVNLRKALSMPLSTIGNYVGGAYTRHSFSTTINPLLDDKAWQTIQSQGHSLSHAASTLRNQPVGLLRYVSDIPSWIQQGIGKPRDYSWELSNIGSYNGKQGFIVDGRRDAVEVEEMWFSQPASSIGPPLNFNVVGLKEGGLNVCVTWQIGSLGLPGNESSQDHGESDYRFVREVVASLKEGLEGLADGL
ncbi:MAG: hypothetical protein M1820_009702 [Bogoriella megaspora]|nr:MAG: hypothetical protein M1820_009702 [Bogoriella megaspora]